MKRLVLLTLTMLAVFLLPSPCLAQLDALFPLTQSVDHYYLVVKTSDALEGVESVSQICRAGELSVSRTKATEFLGLKIPNVEYGPICFLSGGYEPEPDLALFCSNYEVRLVNAQTIAGRFGLVIELYHKGEDRLIMKMVIDQETGLILAACAHDDAGNLIRTMEVVEVDYEPGFVAALAAGDREFGPVGTIFKELTLYLDPDYALRPWELFDYGEAPERFSTLSEAEVLELLPWAQIKNLSLPEGFVIVNYTKTDFGFGCDYLEDRYADLDISSLAIWISDGFFVSNMGISFASHAATTFTLDSALEIRHSDADFTIVTITDRPVAISVFDEFSEPTEVIDRLKEFTQVTGLNNAEELCVPGRADIDQPAFCHLDYKALPARLLTREQENLLPQTFFDPLPFLPELKLVAVAETRYPEPLAQELFSDWSDVELELIDLLILFFDGDRPLYVGMSFCPHGGVSKPGAFSTRHAPDGVALIAEERPFALFSCSRTFSVESQQEILTGLMALLDGNAQYPR